MRWVPAYLAQAAIVLSCILGTAIVHPGRARAQGFPTFSIESYMGRCLDYGPAPLAGGSPVYIDDCNHIPEQQIGIEEFKPFVIGQTDDQLFAGRPTSHEVRLHAGNLCIAGSANPPRNATPVVLEPCSLEANQIFVLDGDSIILNANRELVVQLGRGDTRPKARLSLGHRYLSDIEFWDFIPTDKSTPTSVFVTVSNAAGLQQALSDAGPNTVIQVTRSIRGDHPCLNRRIGRVGHQIEGIVAKNLCSVEGGRVLLQ